MVNGKVNMFASYANVSKTTLLDSPRKDREYAMVQV
jgi:hypothetical protein